MADAGVGMAAAAAGAGAAAGGAPHSNRGNPGFGAGSTQHPTAAHPNQACQGHVDFILASGGRGKLHVRNEDGTSSVYFHPEFGPKPLDLPACTLLQTFVSDRGAAGDELVLLVGHAREQSQTGQLATFLQERRAAMAEQLGAAGFTVTIGPQTEVVVDYSQIRTHQCFQVFTNC